MGWLFYCEGKFSFPYANWDGLWRYDWGGYDGLNVFIISYVNGKKYLNTITLKHVTNK